MSVLNFTTPSVSATNFVFNIVAIPSGVYRYVKEGRMNWPLTWAIVVGTLPGVFIGYYIRVLYLPDPRRFKLFVGMVLFYVAAKLLIDAFKKSAGTGNKGAADKKIKVLSVSGWGVEFAFMGETYRFGTLPIFTLSFVVGVIGGVYGIGGGAIIAPFCVAVLGLPVHAVAGAALMGTLVTSVAGVAFYSAIPSTLDTSPDWALGALFGVGGFVGMYLGARAQKHVPQKAIKVMLGLAVISISLRYILGYFA
jgi:uncharacterized membrane protein YfcA